MKSTASGVPAPRRRLAAAATAVGVAAAALVIGWAGLGLVETGTYSERITLDEAQRMAAGEHRWGIVEYTHYPNGPLYLVAAMTRLGMEPAAMRGLPMAVSAASLGALAFVLFVQAPTRLLRLWVLVGMGVLLLQPGFALWQGALHEHAYAFSLALLAVAAAAGVPGRASWAFPPLGFAAGWIGYDWLPGQALLVVGTRWLCLTRDRRIPLPAAAAAAGLDGLKFASGAALAVLAHLAQLALFFGAFEAAARDLLGAAAARAGSDAAGGIHPEYSEFIRKTGTTHPDRWPLPGRLLAQFLRPAWSAAGPLYIAGAASAVIASLQLRDRPAWRAAAVGLIAVALGFGAATLWTLLMPQHAATHMHMLPRHGLMLVVAGIVLPVLAAEPAREEPGASAPELGIGMLRSYALYAAFPVLAVSAYLYALIGLD